MPCITFTLPPSESSIDEQLARAIGNMPVTRLGSANGRVVTLVGDRAYLVAVLYLLSPGRGYKRAHELAANITETQPT